MVRGNARTGSNVRFYSFTVCLRHTHMTSKIANSIATSASEEAKILIDCFAGVGGNTIAFARSDRWSEIHAIERDLPSLECAKHNAQIYGVRDKVTWHLGDCFEILRNRMQYKAGSCIIFASPPWGGRLSLTLAVFQLISSGPGYRSDNIFNLFTMQPYGLRDLMQHFQAVSSDIVLYLPRTSDVRQLSEFADQAGKLPVIHFCVEGASKVSGTMHFWPLFSSFLGHMRLLRFRFR